MFEDLCQMRVFHVLQFMVVFASTCQLNRLQAQRVYSVHILGSVQKS